MQNKNVISEKLQEAQQHYHELSFQEKKTFELVARSLLLVGRLEEGRDVFRNVGIDPPTELLVSCGDLLRSSGKFEDAASAYTCAKATAKLAELASVCRAKNKLLLAAHLLKKIGAHDQLLEVGLALAQKQDKESVNGARNAFVACGAREELQKLADSARELYLSDVKQHHYFGMLTYEIYKYLGDNVALVHFGRQAMDAGDYPVAGSCFRDAGAKQDDLLLGDRLVQNGNLESAATCYVRADADEQLVDVALRLVRSSRYRWSHALSVCFGFASPRKTLPVQKLLAHAQSLLQKNEDESALELCSAIAEWERSSFAEKPKEPQS